MIPLDNAQRWLPLLDDAARRYLDEAEYREFCAIAPDERARQLKALLEAPIARFTPVNDAYFRARWAEVLRALEAGRDLTLLEVATGDTDMIPQMMARETPGSRYITANMNKRLNASLREKTKDIGITVTVYEQDAAQIGRVVAPDSIDVIAFQHAVNDVIQAILCEREGVDTVESDWMQTLPRMIEMMQREKAQGTLADHAKAPFLSLMEVLLRVLKPGGVVAINHYQFQLDLDWGYPPDLWANFVPLARGWLRDLPGCEEVMVPGFDPQWWLFLKKI